jgi:hypothetical protein
MGVVGRKMRARLSSSFDRDLSIKHDRHHIKLINFYS